MYLSKKQVVTFDLSLKRIPFDIFANFMPSEDKINSMLQIYQHWFDEIIIVKTKDRVVFYVYTDDYEPLIRLFDGYQINSKHYTTLVSSANSLEHLTMMCTAISTTIEREDEVIDCVKKAVNLSEKIGAVGDNILQVVRMSINAQRMVRKESPIGKYSISLVSKAIDMIAKKIVKPKQNPQSEV